MVLPRMAAMSEVVWTDENQRDFEDFKRRLMQFKNLYEAKGFNYATHVFETIDDSVSQKE